MRITICCVGKVKEKFYCQAIDEYSKRLSRYCKLEVKEVADEKTPDNACVEAGFVDAAEYLVSAACQTKGISLSCVRF